MTMIKRFFLLITGLVLSVIVFALPERENTNALEKSGTIKDASPFVAVDSVSLQILSTNYIIDASPEYGSCIMELVSKDGGKTGMIMLNFQKIEKYSKGRVREKNVIYSSLRAK